MLPLVLVLERHIWTPFDDDDDEEEDDDNFSSRGTEKHHPPASTSCTEITGTCHHGWFYAMLGIESRISCMLGKHPTNSATYCPRPIVLGLWCLWKCGGNYRTSFLEKKRKEWICLRRKRHQSLSDVFCSYTFGLGLFLKPRAFCYRY